MLLTCEPDTVPGGPVCDLERKGNNEPSTDHTELLRAARTSGEWEKLQVDLPKAGEGGGRGGMKWKVENHWVRRDKLSIFFGWARKSLKESPLRAWGSRTEPVKVMLGCEKGETGKRH